MSDYAFIIVTILAILFFYFGTGKKKVILFSCTLWLLATGVLAYTGFFLNTKTALPRIMLVVNLPAIVYIICAYRTISIECIRQRYLFAVHGLRVPVEFILFQLYLGGMVPVIMTFKGWNFDIIMGVSAIIILLYIAISGKELSLLASRIWNIAGIVFLTIIVTTAVLSAPSPIQQFAFDRPNIAITQFPYTLLPALVVPIVLLSHLLSLKATWSREDKSTKTGER